MGNAAEHDTWPPIAVANDTGIRIVTLTTAPPIHIRDAEWPIIGSVEHAECGYPGSQNERKVWLKVRRNGDGRLLVYGTRVIGTSSLRGGELVPPGDDVFLAIERLTRLLAVPLPLAETLASGLRNLRR